MSKAIDDLRSKYDALRPMEFDAGTRVLQESSPSSMAVVHHFPAVWLSECKPNLECRALIKRIINGGELVVLYGASGEGKTFVAIDLACCIATGTPWRGRRVTQSLVVYIAAEAGRGITNRMYAWLQLHDDIDTAKPTPFVALVRAVNLLVPGEVHALIIELERLAHQSGVPLGLVVIDTVSRSMSGGDENGPRDMTSIIGAVDQIRHKLNAAVLLVHHTGKEKDRGPRGHYSLAAAADAILLVDHQTISVEKSRDGAIGEQFGFALDVVEIGQDTDGDTLTTCVVRELDRPSEAAAKRPPLPGAAKTALASLQTLIGDCGEVMPGTSAIPPGVRAVRIKHWRDRFLHAYGEVSSGNDSSREKAFSRAKDHLLKYTLIGIHDPYVWTT